MDVLGAIADERRRAADFIESLTDEQLATPSLCAGWTVKQVAAHLVAAVASPGGTVVRTLLLSGLRPDRANTLLAADLARRPIARLAAELREHADSRFRLPVIGYAGPFTDLQIHGQDMRRPLGLPHYLQPDRMRYSLDFLTGGHAVGFTPARRIAGLRFEVPELHWTHGDGPLVSGLAEPMLLALTGRRVVLPELTGPGVEILAGRR